MKVPLKLEFRCLACGKHYRVGEKTFRKFTTVKVEETLEDHFKKGAVGAVLVFEESCPKCKPNGRSRAEVRPLYPDKKPEAS